MPEYYVFKNKPLPYAYNALEPYIDELTMHLHHDAHLQTYIDNLNKALSDYPMLQKLSLVELVIMSNYLPKTISSTIKNNAGGVFNHEFYFSLLNPHTTSNIPTNALTSAIINNFGSMDIFIETFTKRSLALFGSGYCWLVADMSGKLSIISSANQEVPVNLNLCLIMVIDVWEHAYYLKNYNKRGEYLKNWFSVLDWHQANQNYEANIRY